MTKLTPVKSIRKYCLWCMNRMTVEIKVCPITDCPLYLFRLSKRPKGNSPLKAIKKHCLPDCAENRDDVKNCLFNGINDELCPLWQYRFGKRPKACQDTVSCSKSDSVVG